MKTEIPGRLGAPLALHAGEWLHTAISRWAFDIFGVSRAALLHAFGLDPIYTRAINMMGNRLSAMLAASIEAATGIPAQRLREATMEHLDGSLLWLAMDGQERKSSRIAKGALWSWQAGTRYCPDCLREQPGVFQLTWRSPWIFACLKHQRLLHDTCSACHQELSELRGRNSDRFDINTCRSNIAEPGAPRAIFCRAALADTWDEIQLATDSPPLQAQEAILTRLGEGTAMDLLCSLQPVAIGLSGARALNDIAELSGLDQQELAGLLEEEKRVGLSAPRNAYAMAAVVGAAYILLNRDDDRSRTIIRNATFARPPARAPRDAGYGPGSPRELLARWPSAPPTFRFRVLRALDADLTTGQRILWDTSNGLEPRALDHPLTHAYDHHKRASGIPPLLWADWCSRLDVNGAVEAETLARTLARVVRVAGAQDLPDVVMEFSLAALIRPNMLGTWQQANTLIAAISRLAHSIDHHDLVIDYPRRAALPVRDLLPRTHWSRLCESIKIFPGKERRHRNARRYLWQRITGTGIRDLPGDLRVGTTRDDTAEYTVFCTEITRDIQRGLDNYAHAFLNHHGIHEPITWSPPAPPGKRWPGAEILDLDVPLLHSMLRSGIYSHRRLAEALHTTPRRVLRAINAAPPPTVRRPDHPDWRDVLPLQNQATAL
ncbi:TniQ family protein [Leifsonia sp. NPDC014704]|uniref:TniQ family protein n=1 Tax=Leifsonia sp. NPDC014704 TaxID=3364123 RepID=UPI0036F451C8